MTTVAQIIDRAAGDLGIKRLNQPLQDQDKKRIESAYNEVYADLKEDGLATWTSSGEIPSKVVPFLATLMAVNCLNNYGVSDKRYQRIKLAEKGAKRGIRRLVITDHVSSSEPTDF